MKPYIIQLSGLLFLLAFHWHCNITGAGIGNLNGWDHLDIPCAGDFTPHALGINSDGVMLLAGHDEEIKDCGTLNIFNCSPYKIFRSTDHGDTWQELSNPLIGERHAFTKGDKANPALLGALASRFGTAIRIGKKILDLAVYTNFDNKGAFYADGKDFYLYVDYILYRSSDAGTTWTEIQIEHDYVLPISTKSTVCFQDNYLLIHDILTYEKYAFKRIGNKFMLHSDNNFALLTDKEGRRLVFGKNSNLAARYVRNAQEKKQICRRIENPEGLNQYGVAEFYMVNKNIILGNFVGSSSQTSMNYPFAMVSKNQGISFNLDDLPTGLPSDCLNGLQVIGLYKQNPAMLVFCEQVNISQANNYTIVNCSYYFWNLKANKLEILPIPVVEYVGGHMGFFADLIMKRDFAYFFTSKGLFRRPNK